MSNKVLVVEDEQILAENLKTYLETLRCHVQTAADGASAIHHIEHFFPHVLILDFRLPDMEGFAVFDSIAPRWRGACVVITAHPTSEVCDGAARRGIQHILFKPFPLRVLGQLVSYLLGIGSSQEPDNPEGIVDRRSQTAASFPLQLYDGTWLAADRRHTTQRDTRNRP